MNRAETYALEQPWIAGPFRWPPEIDMRKWKLREEGDYHHGRAAEREQHNADANAKVMAALAWGLALTPINIGMNCGLTHRVVGAALKRLEAEGLVERTTAISNFWRLA